MGGIQVADIAGAPQGGGPETTTDKEKEFLALLQSKEDEGMACTRAWGGMWRDTLCYFLSDQLRSKRAYDNWEWVTLNYVWPAIFQEMAKLSRDFKPITEPVEEGDTEVAEAVGGFLEWQWLNTLHEDGMDIQQLKAILDRKLYGYSVSKILWENKPRGGWNKEERRWDGEVRYALLLPSTFWASDSENINDGDCGTVRYIELEYAKSLWPDFAETLERHAVSSTDVEKDSWGVTIGGQTENTSSGTYPDAGTGFADREEGHHQENELLSLVLKSSRGTGSGTEVQKYVRISEIYLLDREERKQTEDLPATAEQLLNSGMVSNVEGRLVTAEGEELTSDNWPTDTLEWDEPLYPNGRYIVRCKDTILNPAKKDQVYPFKRWPFVVVPHYLLPHMWQGSDAVTLYKSTQDHINVAMSHLLNNMKEFGDPRIAVESDALAVAPGPTKKRFSILKGAGAVIRLARGGLRKFQIVPPVPPSAASMLLYQVFVQEFKNIQGMQDISQGKKTSGDTTATEAQFLAMSSNDRIKLQNKFEELWAQKIYSLVADFDQYYYEVGRVVRVLGEGHVVGAQKITERAKEIEFDVKIEAGTALPFDEEKRIQKYTIAYNLLKDPTPNPLLPEFLRVLNISAWQKLLTKHQIWQKWVAFEKLVMAAKKGEIAPEDAAKLLLQRAIIEFKQLGGQINGNGRNGRPKGREDQGRGQVGG